MKVLCGRIRTNDPNELIEQIDAIGAQTRCAIQAFDARYIACERQLRRAVDLAIRAFDRGEAVAHDPSIEVLLYAAGRRQIDQALEMGVSTRSNHVVIVVDGATFRAARREAGDDEGDEDRDRELTATESVQRVVDVDSWTAGDKANEELIMEFFDISSRERSATSATLCDLVCERVVLLEIEK